MKIIPLEYFGNIFYSIIFDYMPLNKAEVERLVKILTCEDYLAEFLLYLQSGELTTWYLLMIAFNEFRFQANKKKTWLRIVSDWVKKDLNPAMPEDYKVDLTLPEVFYVNDIEKAESIYYFNLSSYLITECRSQEGFYNLPDGKRIEIISSN